MKPLPDRFIVRTLELSTAHIPWATVKHLEAGTLPYGLYPTPWRDTGWVFAVPDHSVLVLLRLHGYSELVALLKLAQHHKCDYLNLDADAYQSDDLPTFDW